MHITKEAWKWRSISIYLPHGLAGCFSSSIYARVSWEPDHGSFIIHDIYQHELIFIQISTWLGQYSAKETLVNMGERLLRGWINEWLVGICSVSLPFVQHKKGYSSQRGCLASFENTLFDSSAFIGFSHCNKLLSKTARVLQCTCTARNWWMKHCFPTKGKQKNLYFAMLPLLKLTQL